MLRPEFHISPTVEDVVGGQIAQYGWAQGRGTMSETQERTKTREAGSRTSQVLRIFILLDFVLLGLLAASTYRSQRFALGFTDDRSIVDPTTTAGLLAVALAASWLVLVYIATAKRRPANLALYTAAFAAITAIVLALASYLPCAGDAEQWTAIVGWVLYLFTGSLESGTSAGAACAELWPPGLVLARTTALIAVFGGAVAALALLWRHSIDRWASTFAGDVDVVVGLNDESLPLIEALIVENRERPRRETWLSSGISNWKWHDIRAVVRPRAKVIVFGEGASPDHEQRVRSWGGIVLHEEPTDGSAMLRVLGKRRWYFVGRQHAAVRRFYAVDRRSQVNIKAYEMAKLIIGGSASSPAGEHAGDDQVGLEPRPDTIVPRLAIRLESARDAREWRLREVASISDDIYSDALCTERLAAAAIVDDLLKPFDNGMPEESPRTAWVYGGESLGLALAEEFAWQLWARYEVWLMSPWRGDEKNVYQPALERIVFVGDGAKHRAHEWNSVRGPYDWPQWAKAHSWSMLDGHKAKSINGRIPELLLFDVDAKEASSPYEVETKWTQKALLNPGRHVFVFAEDSAACQEVARRLVYARTASGKAAASVYLLDSRVEGPEFDAFGDPSGTGPRRVGPSLVRRVRGRPVRSSDIASRLARQQHRVFGQKWSGLDAKPPEAKSKDSTKKATQDDWDELGPFFVHENIRQIWMVLQAFGKDDDSWNWSRVGVDGVVDGAPGTAVFDPDPSFQDSKSSQKLEQLAQAEHTRWKELREELGWKTGPRNDPERNHNLLVDWEKLAETKRKYNKDLLLLIIARLYALGIVPVAEAESTQP